MYFSHAKAQNKSTEAILQSFVESYQNDHMAHTTSFGIKVGEDWWHVQSQRNQSGYDVGKKKQYTFHNLRNNKTPQSWKKRNKHSMIG